MKHAAPELVYQSTGYCPICEASAEFTARFDWYRDHLLCSRCHSVPRERAFALMLTRRFPQWRELAIHEFSPEARGISVKMAAEGTQYVATRHVRHEPLGKIVAGLRNENIEVQTFPDESFDLVVSLDAMDKVNEPELALSEISRTLKPGGAFLFTVPTYREEPQSERLARLSNDGSIEHFAEPERGETQKQRGTPLTLFHFGNDLPDLMYEWSGMDVEVSRFLDHRHGVIGEFTDVYLATKSTDHRTIRAPRTVARSIDIGSGWPREVRKICEATAQLLHVSAEVHRDDPTFRFLYEHPGFPSKQSAIEYYFSDGAASAARLSNLVDRWAPHSSAPLTILDFGAGYGAVARHAQHALSPHVVHSCDPAPKAVEFLLNTLSLNAVQGADDPVELVLDHEYDVVFALAFFSRLSDAVWERWMQRLYAGLRSGGILVFTTHGRSSLTHFPGAVLDDTGFWFEESHPGSSYGQCVTSKEYVDRVIRALPNSEYLTHEPAIWWGHQDLYIVRKC